MKRGSGPRRKYKPKGYDAELSLRFYETVCHPKAKCAQCGARRRPDFEAHHAIAKQVLESWCSSHAVGFVGLDNAERNRILWDPRNGVALCRSCHEAITNAAAALPRSSLPATVWEFAIEMQQRTTARGWGTGWAESRLERQYPVAA